MQKPVLHRRPGNFDPVGQHEGALEGAGGDASVQEDTFARIIGLTTADDKLAILDRDRQVFLTEPGDGQGDPVGVFRNRLDVERGIALGPGFRGAFDQPFQLFKPQKIGMGPKAQFRHHAVLAKSDHVRRPRIQAPLTANMGGLPLPRKLRQSALSREKPQNSFHFSCGFLYPLRNSRNRTLPMNAPMELDHDEMLRIRLEVLRREHRDLDEAIHALEHNGRPDPLTLRRLKKQKLALKDQIVKVEDMLIPDIIA